MTSIWSSARSRDWVLATSWSLANAGQSCDALPSQLICSCWCSFRWYFASFNPLHAFIYQHCCRIGFEDSCLEAPHTSPAYFSVKYPGSMLRNWGIWPRWRRFGRRVIGRGGLWWRCFSKRYYRGSDPSDLCQTKTFCFACLMFLIEPGSWYSRSWTLT